MSTFADRLNAKLGGVNITEGKDPVKLNELIKRFPDNSDNIKGGSVSLTGMSFREQGKYGKPYCIFTIAEDSKIFSSGAGDFIETYAALLNEYGDGELSTMNALLAANPFKIKVWKKPTKSGNDYTKIKAYGFVHGDPDESPDDLDELDAPTDTDVEAPF